MIGPIVLVILLAVAGGLFARRAWFLFRLVRTGKPVSRTRDLPVRATREVTEVIGQRKLLQRLGPGLMHAFIFWGFIVLVTTIVEAIGLVFDEHFAIPWIGRTPWLGLLQDVFMVLVIVGIAMALFFRKVRRDDRFIGSHMEEADFVLLMILGIMLTLLGLNAVTVAQGTSDSPAAWMPVSNLVGTLVFAPMSEGWLDFFFQAFLWSHIVIILAFLVYVPFSKHLHVFTSSLNVFFASTRRRGRLEPLRIDMENLTEDTSLGIATIGDLTWKQMLDTMTCTECGRCQDVCPAWNTGKELSPKLLVMNLRDHLFDQGPDLIAAAANGERGADGYEPVQLNPGIIEDQVVWDCTTCGACMQECPVDIEHIDHIVGMRRNLVMAESRFPAEAGSLLRNLERSNNPWGMPQDTRADWAAGLGVRILEPGEPAPEYLYWVGCAGSFDDRAKAISAAVVKLLQRAGLPFAILGSGEGCTGDPARRMGNEYLFQTMAEANVETLDGHAVRKIITNCPHCFNTLANEYPDYEGHYEVIHHTELLADLMRRGRLEPTDDVEGVLAYHDPCYLGRHNEIYEAPRAVLRRIPLLETVEMPRHGARGLCCGAGGARMWMEETQGKRINEERMDEAASTGAGSIGVACPYCLIMLDDGAKARGDEGTEVLDVAQVVARSLGAP